MMQLIIFTDLDGTLLDKGYSFKKADKALAVIKKRKIPLIFCTSKTMAETEFWQGKLSIKNPFIVENGGAIIIPEGCFKNKNKKIIKLGTHIKILKKILKKTEKKTKSRIIYFSEMSIKEVREYCNLSLHQAKKSKIRTYTEPFKVLKGDLKKIKKLIKKNKLNYTRAARFHYIMGDNDKGKAVEILTKFYKEKYGRIKTVGLGDSLNDQPMLDAVDKPFLLKKGPFEWNQVILKLLC